MSTTIDTNAYVGVGKRYIIPPSIPFCTDVDVLAFIANIPTGLTIPQANALCKLVTRLKYSGLWSKLHAIYPMIGGNADSCKLELKDPTQHALIYNGGLLISNTGITPNGINGYANTGIDVSTVAALTPSNISMGYYSRTQSPDGFKHDGGGYNPGVSSLILRLPVSGITYNNYNKDFGSVIQTLATIPATATYSLGLSVMVKLPPSTLEVYHNGVIVGGGPIPTPATLYAGKIVIGCRTNNATPEWYGDKECAWFHIGTTLDAPQNATLYTIVQQFQTDLGRQV